jgi:hypothetical protein
MVTGRGKALILLAVCVGFAFGCGARTDMLFDEGSGGALGGYPSGGDGDTSGFASAGYTTGGYGNVSGYGGSISVGGAPVGGFGSAGFTQGGFHAGGSGSAGAPFGGFGASGGFSGSFGTGGAAGAPFGGFGGVAGAGEAGAGGSGGIVELCVGAAQSACDKCVCSTCGSQLNACFTDIGCALIFACVQEQQCGLNCYQNATCRGVIDQFGGLTGSAVNEVFSLASCSVTTRPGCGCN